MRLFLAVPCGEQLALALTTALDAWRHGPPGRLPVRWTHPDTWHLTLQFLGEWPPERLPGLIEALSAAQELPCFAVPCGRIGCFEDRADPRVLFLHMEDDGQAAQLAGRVREIVNAAWPEGPQDNRPFHGHLTVARARTRLSLSHLKAIRENDLGALPPLPVPGFSLLASIRGPRGSRYVEQAFFALRK